MVEIQEEPLLDGFTKEEIRMLCEANEKGELELNFLRNWFEKWKYLTRILLNNGKVALLFSELDRISEEVANNQWTDFELPKYYPPKFTKRIYKDTLNRKVKITRIAEDYGLKIRGEKAICPFHPDTNPSLSFSNEKGVFHCFGCGVKGDILTFVKKMEELNGNKRRS